ncbi:restriction endonuclease [Petrimonas sp.]|uniref:restriction endonuclease n=1 Tax=Petrimonas sp. TaxID=2023866 RepID=UPI003F51A212
MNYWTQISIDYANQRSYLDDLFHVYPTIPEGVRELDNNLWSAIEASFNRKDNDDLMRNLLKMKLFPIKDSYVAYLKKDSSSIERNPKTINRLCGRLYEMGIDKIYERCTEPKETNRQIGPMFNNWIKKKSLGLEPVKLEEFLSNTDDAILGGTDIDRMRFARTELNYFRNKGLDFIARFNGKYVIGEAKFLSSDGGSQNSDFEDAIATLEAKETNAVRIAILDGILYIKGNTKMHKFISNPYKDYNIMSSLVLREFLYQL